MIKVLKTKNKRSGKDPGVLKEKEATKVLFALHHQSEEEQTSALANQLNLPYIDTNLIPVDNDSLKMLSEEDSRKFNLAIIQKAGKKVTLAYATRKGRDYRSCSRTLTTFSRVPGN